MNASINFDFLALIAEELAPYRDEDTAAFWDTLDGETDVLAYIDAALEADAKDAALIEAQKALAAQLRARQSRIEMRKEATRRFIGKLLSAAGMKSAERPLATVSVRPGNVSVSITDETSVPSQLCTVKTTTTPDKKAIKAQIEAGETVPGAELTRGNDIVTVRAS